MWSRSIGNRSCKEAVARRAIDAAAGDLADIGDVDLIVLAAPVRQNIVLLRRIAEHASPSTVVTDVGGTKRTIVEAATALAEPVTFVGGHPLGGGARGGFEFATASLFVRRPWIFTPHDESRRVSVVARLSDFATGLGALPSTMTADAARSADGAHQPSSSAGRDGADGSRRPRGYRGGLRMAGQGLVDTTRLASSPADVWRDICVTNADEIRGALDLLIERLSDLRSDLQRAEVIDAVFDDAGRWRAELMKGRD